MNEKSTREGGALSGMEYEAAYKTALNIISHADNTANKLKEKLKKKGISEKTILLVISSLSNEGIFNERRHFSNAVSYYADKKLFGKSRIRLELIKKGFEKEIIDTLDDELSEVDFGENCAMLMVKKRMAYPKDNNELRKLASSLARYGYTYSEIKYALKKMELE